MEIRKPKDEDVPESEAPSVVKRIVTGGLDEDDNEADSDRDADQFAEDRERRPERPE